MNNQTDKIEDFDLFEIEDFDLFEIEDERIERAREKLALRIRNAPYKYSSMGAGRHLG